MKLVQMKPYGEIKSAKEMFINIMRSPPKGSAVDYQLMASRCRVLDVLEELPEDATEFLLEDADHTTMHNALKQFQFGMAHRDLFRVVKQIEDAEDFKPPSPAV